MTLEISLWVSMSVIDPPPKAIVVVVVVVTVVRR